MSKFWNVARWFIDPVGSLGGLLSRSGLNSDKFDFSYDQIGNTLKGAWNDWTGNTANQANIDYQKEYNAQVFNRADTHYQTTVADLRAAGLSPQLAFGAPSTVAGAGAAPQRTVGNESAAIERLVGLVNAIKQTNSNVALASAQADEANANTANKNADTNLKNLEAGTYTERTVLEMNLKASQMAYNNALTFIAQQEGQTYMNRIQADINYKMSQTSYNKQLIELAKKQSEVYDSQIGVNNMNVSFMSAQKDKTRQEIENLKQQKANLVQDFTNKVKEGLHLDAQTALLVQQAVNAKIDADILSYNLQMSKDNGLRTNDQISRFFGINLGVDSSISKLTDWFKNYKGVGGFFPSWNEIFAGK